MSERKWLHDLRQLSDNLQQRGVTVGHVTVRRLLQEHQYALKTNRKERSESSPERDRQFHYIERVKQFIPPDGSTQVHHKGLGNILSPSDRSRLP